MTKARKDFSMVITYKQGDGLYVNMTNLCTNSCAFCVRDHGEDIYGDLWLESEPTRDEIYNAIIDAHPEAYSELVFCGFGEPTCRLYDMLTICKALRAKYDIPIRLNTNGHASLIMGEDTAPLFKGLFDTVSISLNAPDSETYNKLCAPKFGEETFEGVLKFARDVAKVVPHVVLTAVRGTVSEEDLQRCAEVARGLGLEFRIREYI